jgi:intracellular multiplication protein IcmK
MVVLTPNLVTALVFMDSTGTPWPVTSSVLGNGSLFKVDILKDDNLNRVIISPLTAHGNSNLVITLKDHGIPLIIRLETRSGVDAQRKVDGLIIYQVQERGPLATPRLSREELPTPVNDLLYLILDGIIPESGIKLESAPKVDETTFLKLGDALFVRTRQTLLWPAYRARASGAGGYAVYETVYLSSIIMGIEDEIQRVNLSLPEGAS